MAEDTKVAAGTAPVVVEEVVVKKVDEEEEPVEKLEEEEISSYKVSELADLEKKALREFKELISDAISKRELTKKDTPPKTSEQPKPEEPAQVEEEKEKEVEPPAPPPEEVELWGVRILADEKSDVVLLKFLRARDFKAKDVRNSMTLKEFHCNSISIKLYKKLL